MQISYTNFLKERPLNNRSMKSFIGQHQNKCYIDNLFSNQSIKNGNIQCYFETLHECQLTFEKLIFQPFYPIKTVRQHKAPSQNQLTMRGATHLSYSDCEVPSFYNLGFSTCPIKIVLSFLSSQNDILGSQGTQGNVGVVSC